MGDFYEPMPYKPSKEHLDNQIPNAFKTINGVLKDLRASTGADERYIGIMLDALARDWAQKSTSRDGFGFR